MDQMSSIYSTVNGVPSVTNGQCVLIDETQNMVHADTSFSPVSVTSSAVDVHDTITDTGAVRARTARRKSIVSLSDINLKPSKLVLVIGLCLVVGLSLPSVIFFYVPVDAQSHDDMYSSVNFSMVNVLACLYWLMA